MWDKRELDDLMDAWMDMMGQHYRWLPEAQMTKPPRRNVEWEDRNGEIAITMDMPGVDKKDIELNVDKHMVSISAKTEGREYNVSKKFDRELNPDKVTAKFNNGVLDVTIQKAVESKGKQITIK
tara:strand:+ start:1512 stop:1883 length:372 start_codon:yes stop_codon:yes gene_type:complete